jgi:hypothetical protein
MAARILVTPVVVAFRLKRRHFYCFSLPMPLFSLPIDNKLRQRVAILPNIRQEVITSTRGGGLWFAGPSKGPDRKPKDKTS